MTDEAATERTCPWCAATAPEAATRCPSCGAALAQRESIGDVPIAGVTAVDPALAAVDGKPIHLTGPSPTHGIADAAFGAAMIGGPAGLVVLGGIAAVAAAEYAGAKRPGITAPEDLESIGRPSELALRALERIEAGDGASPPSPIKSAGPHEPASSEPAQDPWRDLPAG